MTALYRRGRTGSCGGALEPGGVDEVGFAALPFGEGENVELVDGEVGDVGGEGDDAGVAVVAVVVFREACADLVAQSPMRTVGRVLGSLPCQAGKWSWLLSQVAARGVTQEGRWLAPGSK